MIEKARKILVKGRTFGALLTDLSKPFNCMTHVKTVYNRTEALTFLVHRIWEIVPDYIKKSNSFEKFKLKIKLWKPRKLSMQAVQKVLTASLFFVTCF